MLLNVFDAQRLTRAAKSNLNTGALQETLKLISEQIRQAAIEQFSYVVFTWGNDIHKCFPMLASASLWRKVGNAPNAEGRYIVSALKELGYTVDLSENQLVVSWAE